MKSLLNFVCGVQPVRVVYGDGEVLYLPPQTTVDELLQSYPHHFVCQPGLHSSTNQMLLLDVELQSDCIYFLLPVPRMFPTAPFSSSQCKCYQVGSENSVPSWIPNGVPKSPLRVYNSPQRIGGLGSPLRGKSLREMLKGGSKSKVLPDESLYSAGRDEAAVEKVWPLWRTCPWRPRLGCIDEDEDLEVVVEEVRCRGFLRRWELQNRVRVPVKPPDSPRPHQLKPSKSSRVMADTQIEWSSATAGAQNRVASF